MDVGASTLGLIMRIVTWNINSVRLRLALLLDYLNQQQPDVMCLQEIKCLDEAFPRLEIEQAGYNVYTHGQKTFNGVAILSKRPAEISIGLPGMEDDPQARYIEAIVPNGAQSILRIASLYLPNGNPAPGDKYDYKMRWMDCLIAHAKHLLSLEEICVLAGDYNVIPDERDVHDPKAWASDALFLPQTREKFRTLLNLGFADAQRLHSDADGLYTFWDYQAGAWPKNNGIRIDHCLLSPRAQDVMQAISIDRDMRGQEKPSDHVPVRLDLKI
jgi:exodeoxyribonuclease-3